VLPEKGDLKVKKVILKGFSRPVPGKRN